MRHRWSITVVGFVLAIVLPTWAELPVARMTAVFPTGGKPGNEVEVGIIGVDLDEVKELRFSTGGVVGRPKLGADGTIEANRFLVSIDPKVTPGVYDVRAVGRFGVTNPRSFVVDELNEVVNKGGNTAAAGANQVTSPTVVNGVAEANAAQYYRFSIPKGKRFFVEAVAREIDSRMEPVLVLFDVAGVELAAARRGEILDFTAPASGAYLIKVHDVLFRGGPEYFYRLRVHEGPVIDLVWPPSAVAGGKSVHTVYGRGLPGGVAVAGMEVRGQRLEKIEIEVKAPADAIGHGANAALPSTGAALLLDSFEYRLAGKRLLSNPLRVYFANGPVVTETEASNDRPEEAQKISAPCEFVGRFYPRGDRDWVEFDAPAGAYWVEVISQRMGLPTSPAILIQKLTKSEKGEGQAADVQDVYESPAPAIGAELSVAARDPVYRLEVKEAGRYRVLVRDLFNSYEDNAARVYRLVIRKEAPDFRLVAVPQSPLPEAKDSKDVPLWTTLVRRGGVGAIRVGVIRRDGFNGEVRVTTSGLPAGVRCEEMTVPAGSNSGTLLISAAEDAAAWVGAIRVAGAAKIGEVEVRREARSGTVSFTNYDAQAKVAEVRSRACAELMVAVSGVEVAPVGIELKEPKGVETWTGGKATIPLSVKRRGEGAAVALKLAGLPQLAAAKEVNVDAKAESANLEFDAAGMKLPAGRYTVYVEGQGKVKYRANPEAAAAAEAEAKAADKEAAEMAAAAKEAAERLKAIKEDDDTAAKAAALKAAMEADERMKKAEARKAAAAARAKEMAAKAQPKDVTGTFYSTPIVVTVGSVPFAMKVGVVSVEMEAGGVVGIPVTVSRLAGFAEAVEISGTVASAAPGIEITKGSIAKEQNEGQVRVVVGKDVAPGSYVLKVQAKVSVGGKDAVVERQVGVKVVGAVKG